MAKRLGRTKEGDKMKKIFNYKTKCNGLGEFKIVFNGGAGIEKEGFRGISHLVEHCMCEKLKSIDDKLKEKGLTMNAYTSDTLLAFYIHGQTKYIKEMLKEFIDAVLKYDVPKEVFEREKKVISTEYTMTMSGQDGEMYTNLFRKRYNSFGPVGLKADIESITYEKFKQFKEKFYKNPSFLMYSHPKDDSDLTEQFLKKTLSYEIKYNDIKRWNRKYIKGEYDVPLEDNVTNETSQCMYALTEFEAVKDDNFINYTYCQILSSMLAGSLTSILFKELREKEGLVYSISAYPMRLTDKMFIFAVDTMSDTGKMKKIVKRLKEIFSSVSQRITEKLYKTTIKKMNASIETSEFLDFSGTTDMAVLEHKKNLTKRTDELLSSYKKFKKFVSSLELSKLDYYINTDFKNEKK